MPSYRLDEDVALESAAILRGRGYDIVTYRELGLLGVRDFVQLLTAAESGRALITHNRLDFILLHGAWFHWSNAWKVPQHHSGILLLEQPLAASLAADAIQEIDQSGWVLDDRLYYFTRRSGWSEWIER